MSENDVYGDGEENRDHIVSYGAHGVQLLHLDTGDTLWSIQMPEELLGKKERLLAVVLEHEEWLAILWSPGTTPPVDSRRGGPRLFYQAYVH